MNAGQKSARRVASGNVLSRDTVCSSCLHRLSTHTPSRRYAAAAAAIAEDPAPAQPQRATPLVTADAPRKAFKLSCSPVLSRPPLITRNLTPFEKAFYLYQKRLNERLALPFTRYFYYQKGTPADIEWKRKAKARKGVAARDVGPYDAYAEEAWNDEVLVGSRLSEPDDIVEKLILDAEGKNIIDAEPQGDAETGGGAASGDARLGEGVRKPVSETVIERPRPRITEADGKNDVRSLNRKLDRTLYLVMRNKDGRWRFPQDRVYGKENMHQAAERILLQAGGINMNTWVVGNHPVGHYISHPYDKPKTSKVPTNRLVPTSKEELYQEEFGEKVFFMKSRIMAGQADITKNELGDIEFQWLTKEEIRSKTEGSARDRLYWDYIKNMLSER